MLKINSYRIVFTSLVLFIVIIIVFLAKKWYKEGFTSTNNSYTAVIIEPREHPALEFVLKNFLHNLNKDWRFIIFHGNKNEKYVNNIIDTQLSKYKERITLKSLNVDNLTITEYNKLLVSKEFYKDIPTEIFLIFQTDTLICEEHKELIHTFINYDYVGAPWNNGGVGNGGLSLRRKSKMLEVIQKCPYDGNPEDVYFAESCPSIYRKKPSFEEAKTFSVENVYNDVSFGVHKPWLELNDTQLSIKNTHCKGVRKLKKLNTH